MANLKQVAERAGVSTATVSNVLAGIARVSERTRQRVLAAVRELDYHPDLIAQSLRTRSTKTLGMIIPDIANPFFPQLVRGAEDAAWEERYLVITFNTDEQRERERSALALMRSRRVDGLLVIVSPLEDGRNEILQAAKSGMPIVALDRKLEGAGMDLVLVDNRMAARRAVEEMMRSGGRRIAFIGGPESLENARERRQGYEDALRKAGVGIDPDLIAPGDYHRDSGYRQTERLLALPAPPDAIFAANGMMAIGVMDALSELPLTRTRQLVIGHFDDLASAPPAPWSTVTVSQPAYELGFQGAKLLLDRIAGRGDRQRVEIRLQATVKVRRRDTGGGNPGPGGKKKPVKPTR
ncbi:MAG TPA: LacI family DNA-binding transcriptional regulator [Bryobacteraceae bacterium]|nr:LacI family DNA-binding transcriptional regulator [Bryobacteraceae bacterium]